MEEGSDGTLNLLVDFDEDEEKFGDQLVLEVQGYQARLFRCPKMAQQPQTTSAVTPGRDLLE